MSVVIWRGNLMRSLSGDLSVEDHSVLSGRDESAGCLIEHPVNNDEGGVVAARGATLAVAPGHEHVAKAVRAAREWLLARQTADGFWCAELEGDTTLESYMILLEAFFGRRDSRKAAAL